MDKIRIAKAGHHTTVAGVYKVVCPKCQTVCTASKETVSNKCEHYEHFSPESAIFCFNFEHVDESRALGMKSGPTPMTSWSDWKIFG